VGDVEGVLEAEQTLAELRGLQQRAEAVTAEELAAGPVKLLEGAPPWLFTVGKTISEGHAFGKHVVKKGEFNDLGIETAEDFAKHIDYVVSGASGENVRPLSGGRTAYWDDTTRTVVIHNPNTADAGTAFRPTAGRSYFENLE